MEADSSFTEDERATLHSLAEMFSDKDDRDELRRLVHEGTTLREIILAYKTNKRVVSTLKALGGADCLGWRLGGRAQRAEPLAQVKT